MVFMDNGFYGQWFMVYGLWFRVWDLEFQVEVQS